MRAVTLDFWGTLLFDPPGSDNRYKRRRMADFETVLGGIGVKASAAALDRAYDDSAGYLARVWADNRDVPVAEHVRAILGALDKGLPARVPGDVLQSLIQAYTRPILLVPPAIDDGARPALERLRGRGIALALISNTMRTPGAVLRTLLERWGVLACFAHTTFSDEVGVRKPDRAIFAEALRALGVEPAAAVHVGDDAVLDVLGARAAGLRTIQVTSASLKALGAQRPDAVIPSLAALPEAIAALESA
ncbi:MAG TPA: HAD family hydrolase [Methylomirabilota bacterium]|nr:HAD family hydrolase [Methylomirabilota bacterium]